MRPGPVLALIAAAATPPAAAAELLGAYPWAPAFDGAGGWSALWLAPEGGGFVVLSDDATWLRGTLARDAAGAIAGVTVEERGPLLRGFGGPMRSGETDAESLAFADGAFWVGFEGDGAGVAARVSRYDDIARRPVRVDPHPDFARLGLNRGLEALASGPDGTLWAIPEVPPDEGAGFPVWRYADGVWETAFSLPQVGRFLVTGADLGPDGRLYVLERELVLLGFRTRVRSVALDGADVRVELETPLGRHDNLEGIAVRRDPSGRLRLTMISDDDRRPWLLRTEFVEYLLD